MLSYSIIPPMLEISSRMPPAHRFPGWRRVVNFLTPHSALLICALFLLAGIALSGDYGISVDERDWRSDAIDKLNLILSNGDLGSVEPLQKPQNRVQGISFQLPLLLAERVLGLTDYYHIHRLRLTLTHLFFIAGGFCCYLLVWRLFNNRLLALVALLLFLLHPRLYAHSFLNSKDLPFLSMFMIALYLLERAWRRDTAGAFVLLGVAVGILTDLRIMGVMLFPAALALRSFDLLGAGAWGRRKHILVTAGVFALVAGLTPLVLSPYAWSQPLDYLTGALNLTVNHPTVIPQLFQGESILSTETPPHYALTWFAITTPPFILLLGIIGVAAVAWQCLAQCRAIADRNRHSRPALSKLASIGNARLRFGVFLLACFILPLLAVALLNSNMYHSWRLLYFIYAPFCLLAVLGLRWLAAALGRQQRLRWGGYGLAGLGLALIALQMAQLYPQQHIYFNFLVDRATPEYLQTRYDFDYWYIGQNQALEYLLARHPGETLTVPTRLATLRILPAEKQQRLHLARNSDTRELDYDLIAPSHPVPIPYRLYLRHRPDLAFNSPYASRVYNNTILSVKALDGDRMFPAAADAYRQLYRQAIAREPVIRAYYNVYLQDRTLTFIRENCQPGDRAGELGVKIYRPNPDTGPGLFPDTGIYHQSLHNSGVRLDGRCLAVIRLPDYPIAHIIVGQSHPDKARQETWEEWYSFAPAALDDIIAAIGQQRQQTALHSVFEVFLYQDAPGQQRLLYHKPDCSRQEYETRFRLHIYPVDPAALPPKRQEIGFDRRDFYLPPYGGWPGGQCFAIIPLPDYPIAEIWTGQGDLWDGVLYPAADPAALRASDAALAGVEPDARAYFDLYRQGSKLIYRRESCAATDIAADFFLHIVPAAAADLPPERQPHGFANRDFPFARQGGLFDDKCLATVPLPEYPIAAIRTGQYTPEQGQLWSAELTVR